MDKIDFSYAFAPSHRITLSTPSGSRKILTNISKNDIRLSPTKAHMKVNITIELKNPGFGFSPKPGFTIS